MNALRLDDVWFGYGAELAVQGVTLSIDGGETVALLGRNGAGKTTLTRLVVALLQPARGDVRVCDGSTAGLAPEDLADRTAYVFQHADQQLFARTVLDEVAFAGRQMGQRESLVRDAVLQALSALGLEAVASQHPYDLPPATRKLVALAAALAQGPKLLVLDEPTQGLDRAARDRVVAAVREVSTRGGAVLAVTHDLTFVAEALDRAVILDQGRIVADEPAARLIADVERSKSLGLVPPPVVRIGTALRLPHPPIRMKELADAVRNLRVKEA